MTAKTHRLGLTTSEAARHLGVSLSTIRRWSDMGYLNGYRTPGGQRRFSVEQLDEFIDSLQSGGPMRQAEPDPEQRDERAFRADNVFVSDDEEPAPPVEPSTEHWTDEPWAADDAPLS
jgi:excisionase family DNA binding protein